MRTYQYKNYNEYVEKQTFYNKQKLHWNFLDSSSINFIVSKNMFASYVICHGTRSGKEQQYFKEFLGPTSYVIGTEISETATQFPMTVQHDFAIPKSEWINKFDILYSNSFDHSYDPNKTMDTWLDQINDNGKIYIEWSETENDDNSEMDPCAGSFKEFEIFLREYNLIFSKFLNGKNNIKYIYEITKPRI